MAAVQQFPIKPLETFGLGKELRQQHAKHLWEIDRDRVEIRALSSSNRSSAILTSTTWLPCRPSFRNTVSPVSA